MLFAFTISFLAFGTIMIPYAALKSLPILNLLDIYLRDTRLISISGLFIAVDRVLLMTYPINHSQQRISLKLSIITLIVNSGILIFFAVVIAGFGKTTFAQTTIDVLRMYVLLVTLAVEILLQLVFVVKFRGYIKGNMNLVAKRRTAQTNHIVLFQATCHVLLCVIPHAMFIAYSYGYKSEWLDEALFFKELAHVISVLLTSIFALYKIFPRRRSTEGPLASRNSAMDVRQVLREKYDSKRCLTREFYGKYSRTIYVTHPLPPLNPKEKGRPNKKKGPCIKREFFRWHAEMERKRKEQRRLMDSLNKDVGFARTWFLLVKEFPLDYPPTHSSPHDTAARKICEECAEWVEASQRLAVLNERASRYGIDDKRRSRRIAECGGGPGALGKKLSDDVDISNLMRIQIRQHMEERNSLLFVWRRDAFKGAVTTAELRPFIFSQINTFYDELDQMLFSLYSTSEHKQRQVETALQHECTKISFAAVRLYVDTLKEEMGLIAVECRIVGNKLTIPVERIADDIKAPIVEACSNDRVVLTSDTVDEILEECGRFVETNLNVDDISRLSLVMQFNRLVFHSKLPSSMSDSQLLDYVKNSRQYLLRLRRVPKTVSRAIFIVDMSKVWDELQKRATDIVAECTERIVESIRRNLREIYDDFFRFGKVVNFRSMDPIAMLSNRAQVVKLSKEYLPRAVAGLLHTIDKMFRYAQSIRFDGADYDFVMEVAALRILIPRQMAEHSAFFDRRIHVFKQFVRSRAVGVKKEIGEVADRLKRTMVFFDTRAVETYLEEVKKLRPDVQNVADLVTTLNQFEEVLEMPKTHDGDVCLQAANLSHVQVLFEWAKNFYDFQLEFMESSRRGAKVAEGRAFVEKFAHVLRDCDEKVEKLKSLRHFVVQVSMEVETLKEKFEIVEVIGNASIMERHWKKMSDVCGIDLGQFASATVAQICDLRLERFIGPLKQIAFAADREAAILEQIQQIYGFWEETTFAMETKEDLWSIRFPTNLEALKRKAKVHAERMRGFDEPVDVVVEDVRVNMRRWISVLEELYRHLEEWSWLLSEWLRFAPLLKGTSVEGALHTEFAEFRKCAKHWRLFDRFVEKHPTVTQIVEEKHAVCWLRSIRGHLTTMLQGIKAFFERVKRRNPRICLLSDGDLLKILSKTSHEKRLAVLRRECFPFTRELKLTANDCLGVVTFDGEHVELPEVKRGIIEDGDVVDLLQLVEKAVDAYLNRELEALIDSQNLSGFVPRLLQNLYDLCASGNTDSPLLYKQKDGHVYFSLRSSATAIPLLLDFSVSFCLRPLNDVFAKKWASCLVPISQGSVLDSRYLVKQMTLALLCSVHFVSCHALLDQKVMDLVVEAVHQNCVLFVLENIDQLTDAVRKFLFAKLRSRRLPPFPRLLLHSMSRSTTEGDEVERATFLAESLVGSESERSANRITISPSGLDVSTGSSPGTRRSSMRRRRSTLKKSIAESLLQMFLDGGRTFPCVACVGAVAKSTLTEAMQASDALLTWIYFDAFTQNQIVASDVEFATGTGGFLLRNLKESMKMDAQISRGGDVSPTPSEASSARRVSVGSCPLRYVIFYGHRRFFEHFSFIGSLFCSEGVDSFPYAFMTLPDGSNFYAPSNVRFVLCVPESSGLITEWLSRFDIRTIVMDSRVETPLHDLWSVLRPNLRALLKDPDFEKVVIDCFERIVLPLFDNVSKKPFTDARLFIDLCKESMLEALPFAFPSNCLELFRSKLCSTAVNWLVLFSDVPNAVVDAQVAELVAEADRDLSYSVRLPEKTSEWKLSKMDFGRWVRWTDEPTVSSNTKKDLALSQVFICYPAVDRLLSYAITHFIDRKANLVITGPPLSGKSTLLRELVAHLSSIDDTFDFVRFSPFDRRRLEVMQKKFHHTMRALNPKRRPVLIVDDVRFDDALTPLLEMFLDQNLVMESGTPVHWKTNVQLILVMEETELKRCRRQELLSGKVAVIPVKETVYEDAVTVLEQLFEWNLSVKTFSSEYQTIIGPMATASVNLIQNLQMDLWPTMVRLAKGFQFAFSVNVPDVISMIRLWCHEVIRVTTDALGHRRRKEALEALRIELISTVSTPVASLFEALEERRFEEDDFGSPEQEKGKVTVEDTVAGQVERLGSLLFSELLTVDSIDGLGYYAVSDRAALNRAVENVVYEGSRGHADARVDVAVTDYVSEHCQRLMRVCRQSAEHAALVGSRGVSRSGCILVASFGVYGQILHAHWDFASAETAERSWKATISEVIPIVARSNHPLMVVVKLDSKKDRGENLAHCIATLRRWLQRPMLDELLSEQAVLSLGQTILESEKQLTSAMQSNGIRLPGQRITCLLPLDTLKDVTVLRDTLASRISDLLHFVFVVDPGLAPLFKWCTVDYFQPIDSTKLDEMLAKILSEAEVDDRVLVDRTLREMHASSVKVLRTNRIASQHSSPPNQLFAIFDLFTRTFNRKKQFLENRQQLFSASFHTLSVVESLGDQGGRQSTEELLRRLDDDKIELLLLKRDLNVTNSQLDLFETKVIEEEASLKEREEKNARIEKKVDNTLRAPAKAFTEATSKLEKHSAAQLKRFAASAKPSLAAKYSVEALRVLLDPSFVPKRNTLETWTQSAPLLRTFELHRRVAEFRVETVSAETLKKLKRYTENREFRVPKLESESPVAAHLCEWVFATITLVNARESVRKESDAVVHLQREIAEKQVNVDFLRNERKRLRELKERLEEGIARMEERVSNSRRVIDYRSRSARIAQAMRVVAERWKAEEEKAQKQLETLTGSCALLAVAHVLCLPENFQNSLKIVVECKTILQEAPIPFDERVSKRSFYLLDYFRSTSFYRKWPLISTDTDRISLPNTIAALFGNSAVISWKSPALNSAVVSAIKSGTALVVEDFDGVVPVSFLPVLHREVAFENDQATIATPFSIKSPLHDAFRLFFDTRLPLDALPPSALEGLQPVLLSSSDDLPSVGADFDAFVEESQRSEDVFLLKTLSECSPTEILDSAETSEHICAQAGALH
ncbi:hypothetical protein QR680_003850 [Steinernema hermaphroditum]|uniref:AAA+ ATPase domain-containing protein n=1 Tax=Steinernema hermaphroditum TaxID=289476 RepID=A0AA39HMU4_9BILA|nr:hypothetical protein QR680_003850 [Steinernema hermaphroditum]